MANCSISQDLVRSCEFQFGGLQSVLLANKSQISSVEYASTGVVTGITMASGATFHVYEFEPENASFSEEFQGDAISKSFLQTVSLTLAGQTQAMAVQLESLALSTLVAIVRTQDNRYWLVGQKGYGLRASSVNLNSGTAFTDNYINEIVLTGNNAGKASEVLSSLISTIS